LNLRTLHAATAAVFAASLVVQVFLAGLAIPQLGGNGNFAIHRDFGYLIGLITLLVLVTAVIARMGRRRITQSAGLLGLYVVQSSLPYVGIGAIEALHPVNAVVMFVAATWYARTVWNERTLATA
jgi:hypothetical protein